MNDSRIDEIVKNRLRLLSEEQSRLYHQMRDAVFSEYLSRLNRNYDLTVGEAIRRDFMRPINQSSAVPAAWETYDTLQRSNKRTFWRGVIISLRQCKQAFA